MRQKNGPIFPSDLKKILHQLSTCMPRMPGKSGTGWGSQIGMLLA
ncbi:hypothetical protein [Candidatus Formimonas warabiya]|nr:hypothetical protein [Candidatus Formimonas warabiya]